MIDCYLESLRLHLHARRRFAALGLDAESVCFQHRHVQRLVRLVGDLARRESRRG
jgi:hypothetical protein